MGNQFYRTLVEYLEIKTISLAKFSFVLETFRDTDKLIEKMNETDLIKEERFPYWAELWPSSIGLGEYILENQDYFRNKKVLELGCGLGLAGIAARAVNADVVFSDYDPLALEFSRRNFKRNFGNLPKVHLLDWRNPEFQETYDVLIGADILYERQLLKPLQICCEQAVDDEGQVFIAEPGRKMAKEFFTQVTRAGWHCQQEQRVVDLNDQKHTIHIYRMNICCT